jgi:hypothetical protein
VKHLDLKQEYPQYALLFFQRPPGASVKPTVASRTLVRAQIEKAMQVSFDDSSLARLPHMRVSAIWT